jgi:uncharacterized protein (DUF1330 family)
VSCYFIAHINIQDRVEYRRYEDGFDEIFAKYQGKVIALDDRPSLLEGTWPYTRVVMIRFPDEIEARRWYESEEYQQLMQHRVAAAKADVVLVHGRD